MNASSQPKPHQQNTLEALGIARAANLTANRWTVVRPGDIAELRRTNTYNLFEMASFATRMKTDPHGNVTDLLFEIWRRPRTDQLHPDVAQIVRNTEGAS